MSESSGRLAVSVYLPTWCDEPGRPASWAEMRELAQQAEVIGVDSVFVADHTGFDLTDRPRMHFWDGWTLLPAVAAVTSRVTIGPLVTSPLLRHPVALARMASALDEVSGGRIILGLGSADPIERAWQVIGLETEQRYSRFEEAIQIIVPLLREGVVDFHGRNFEAHEAILGPTGPQGSAIPIWIGVKGPRMTRLAARWADAVNFGSPLSSLDEVRSLVSQFEHICREVGRELSTVGKTGWALLSFAEPDAHATRARTFAITGDPATMAVQLHTFHRAGVDHISLYIDAGDKRETTRGLPLTTARGLEQLALVINALRKLEVEA